MTDSDSQSGLTDELPRVDTARSARWQVSLVWVVPLITLLVGAVLLVNVWLSKGPEVVISFNDAQGIQAGKTKVKYKNVVIGTVSKLSLEANHSLVDVTVVLDQNAKDFATEGSRFWIVKPHVGLNGISGLGTILSGPYISADIGNSSKRKKHFKGLEKPPTVTYHEQGTTYELTSPDLGSLDIGAPVYYRHIQVGRIVGYHLDTDGKGVTVKIFVNAPNDKFVTTQTRFWNVSGVDLSVGASGVKVNTESLATIIAGGVAFQNASDEGASEEPASQDHVFTLFPNRDLAMQPPNGEPVILKMKFHQSARGLTTGAEVNFLGVNLGKVTAVSLDYDNKAKRFPVDVTAKIYPQRIGRANRLFIEHTGIDKPGALLSRLVKYGLRAQLRSGNLLTGKLYVALDFFPKAEAVSIDREARPLQMPTVQGSFEQLQKQLADIIGKLNDVPLGELATNLNDTLKQTTGVLSQFNQHLGPQATKALRQLDTTLKQLDDVLSQDSPLQSNVNQTMVELERAARSARTLTDYLSRHPEALLRGRKNEKGAGP